MRENKKKRMDKAIQKRRKEIIKAMKGIEGGSFDPFLIQSLKKVDIKDSLQY